MVSSVNGLFHFYQNYNSQYASCMLSVFVEPKGSRSYDGSKILDIFLVLYRVGKA